MIITSKSFDNGTACVAEQSVVRRRRRSPTGVPGRVRGAGCALARRRRSRRRSSACCSTTAAALRPDAVGQSAVRAGRAGRVHRAAGHQGAGRASWTAVGADAPLSAGDPRPGAVGVPGARRRGGLARCREILAFGGEGHTLARARRRPGRDRPVRRPCRRAGSSVNTPALFGGMGYSTEVDPSFQLGTGTWSGSICSDNVTPLHLINIKRIAHEVRPVADRVRPGGAVMPVGHESVTALLGAPADRCFARGDAGAGPGRPRRRRCGSASTSAPRAACWSCVDAAGPPGVGRPAAPSGASAGRGGGRLRRGPRPRSGELQAASAEAALGVELTAAATAYPPCVAVGGRPRLPLRLRGGGLRRRRARRRGHRRAAHARTCADGVVVDVGGGSTGVGVFRDGRLVALDDRPGGGHHLDLMLAGALGIAVEDAEALQARPPGASPSPILRARACSGSPRTSRALTAGAAGPAAAPRRRRADDRPAPATCWPATWSAPS